MLPLLKKIKKKFYWRKFFLFIVVYAFILFLLISGTLILWAATLSLPDFDTYFQKRALTQSTKIYDRTGQVLLYDFHGDVRKTSIPLSEISDYLKKATIAIEDDDFYNHHGVKISSIIRAFIVNLGSGEIRQGGSTITQQVIKNTLLTKEKKITRKIKESVLALKLERSMDKDQILALYLNDSPYGGTLYGAQEAAKAFFKKDAKDLSLTEAAYLAALPQAPTYYSPYGKNRDKLEKRKNIVLDRMLSLGFITNQQYQQAVAEKINFSPLALSGIKAPHFVFYIKQLLEEKYGDEFMETGLRIVSTLDWELQQQAEQIAKKYGQENEIKYNAKNNGLVAIDPKTGQILAMVGSRDYFDTEIEGNFNITTAHRQPGSSFKPIVYAAAFEKGYTPETVVFDLQTEFNTNCSPTGVSITNEISSSQCYMPKNYDDKFLGPINLRNALAQSRNIPAIKVLYLTGITEALNLAKKMGISSLSSAQRYGLTLVLGGGEVSLLELTNAYGIFANDGVKNNHTGIIKIESLAGEIIEEYKSKPNQVLSNNSARLISSILNDNIARTPAYGENSLLYFPGREVAVKTGTTNDYRDAWIIGYTPSLVIGAWVGNNNNKPMERKIAGFLVAPMWNELFKYALNKIPTESFMVPEPTPLDIKPILRGQYQINGQIHNILYWVQKDNPRGDYPRNPDHDGQFNLWEYPVELWLRGRGYTNPNINNNYQETEKIIDQQINFLTPSNNQEFISDDNISVKLNLSPKTAANTVEYYLNDKLLKKSNQPLSGIVFSFLEALTEDELKDVNELKAKVYYPDNSIKETVIKLKLKQ